MPPSKPIILDGETRNVWSIEKQYNEGSDVNLICEVRGGKPPPKLTWYLDNNVIDESYHYNAETGVTVNHLAYPKIGRQHHKARLICQASNTNLVQPQTKVLVLDVNRKSSAILVRRKHRLRRARDVTSPTFSRRATNVSQMSRAAGATVIYDVMTTRDMRVMTRSQPPTSPDTRTREFLPPFLVASRYQVDGGVCFTGAFPQIARSGTVL